MHIIHKPITHTLWSVIHMKWKPWKGPLQNLGDLSNQRFWTADFSHHKTQMANKLLDRL